MDISRIVSSFIEEVQAAVQAEGGWNVSNSFTPPTQAEIDARRYWVNYATTLKQVVAERMRTYPHPRTQEELCRDIYELSVANIVLAGIGFKETNDFKDNIIGNATPQGMTVKQAIPWRDRLETTFHELGHIIAMQRFGFQYNAQPTNRREFEAEMVSHVMLRHYGIDASWRQWYLDIHRSKLARIDESLRDANAMAEIGLQIVGFHLREWII
jgi:hypothetical protein